MTPYKPKSPLTAEQGRVVEQPADVLILVTAGAGSGKTHTLVRRVDHLLQAGEVPPQNILVLSFSRNAVRQLRRRLSALGGTGRFARVQTFDSWALDVLLECDAGQNWAGVSFEARIAAAVRIVSEGGCDDRFEDLQHVVIDEVQDLVGDRRELVQSLLSRFECGFTVVGDVAQSIYGFQVTDRSRRAREAGCFVAWLRTTFGDDLVELSLTQNFRARTAEARTALTFGPELRDAVDACDVGRPENRYEALRSCLLTVLDFGALDDPFVCQGLRAFTGTTAVLCRNNGQALVVSEQLSRENVPHGLQRAAQDRVVPAWIGELFRHCSGQGLSWEYFRELAAGLSLPADSSLEDMWNAMKAVVPGTTRRTLELSKLRQVLASGRMPDEFNAPPPGFLVSSFHRAKGLEFDRVLVLDPGPLRRNREEADDDVDAAEEARLLYVAMTRPRDDLFRLDAIDTRFLRRCGRTGRWGRYGRASWQRLGMEALGDDVHTEQPAGTIAFSADPCDIQNRLSSKVAPGDPVVLERLDAESAEDRLAPAYLVVHDGLPIGVTSAGFRTALYRFMQLYPRSAPRTFPRTIEKLRIEAVTTVAGSQAAGETAQLGPHGVWLAPRLVGLGRFSYDGREDDGE